MLASGKDQGLIALKGSLESSKSTRNRSVSLPTRYYDVDRNLVSKNHPKVVAKLEGVWLPKHLESAYKKLEETFLQNAIWQYQSKLRNHADRLAGNFATFIKNKRFRECGFNGINDCSLKETVLKRDKLLVGLSIKKPKWLGFSPKEGGVKFSVKTPYREEEFGPYSHRELERLDYVAEKFHQACFDYHQREVGSHNPAEQSFELMGYAMRGASLMVDGLGRKKKADLYKKWQAACSDSDTENKKINQTKFAAWAGFNQVNESSSSNEEWLCLNANSFPLINVEPCGQITFWSGEGEYKDITAAFSF